MLITDVLRCPQCWRVCAHVSSFAFLISQCLILLMFKDPPTTKLLLIIRSLLIKWLVAAAISMMLIIFYSDSVSSVYLEARYKAPSLSLMFHPVSC